MRTSILASLFLMGCAQDPAVGTGTPNVSASTGTTSTGSSTSASTGSTQSSTFTTPTTGTPAGTTTGTTTTATLPANTCAMALATAGFLDTLQTPNNGMVIYCHMTSSGFVALNDPIANCLPHVNHPQDLFPTTLCDS